MSTQVDIPGYVTGTWAIDAARSGVSFQSRLAGLSTVRGGFDEVEGTLVTAADPRDSSVTATVRAESVNTRNTRRDEHLRTADFLDAGPHPTLTFVSTGVRADAGAVRVDGELTLRGNTRPVTLDVEVEEFGADADGTPLVRLVARTAIARADFGVTCGAAGPFIGKKVAITLRITATKRA